MPDDVLEMIGTAALLEQLAEESAELAQAALKMARKLRNENPTTKSSGRLIAMRIDIRDSKYSTIYNEKMANRRHTWRSKN